MGTEIVRRVNGGMGTEIVRRADGRVARATEVEGGTGERAAGERNGRTSQPGWTVSETCSHVLKTF